MKVNKPTYGEPCFSLSGCDKDRAVPWNIGLFATYLPDLAGRADSGANKDVLHLVKVFGVVDVSLFITFSRTFCGLLHRLVI
jgi:hypothetical protein